MQLHMPVRAPAFFSRRRLFAEKLADLQKCTNLNELKQLHALIYKFNLHNDLFVAPKLISGLSLCGQVGLAINVFNQVPNPNAHMCNNLIKAYIRNSEPDKAFKVFRKMQSSGIFPDYYTYTFILKASWGLNFVKMIHAHVEKRNLSLYLFVQNSLLDAYSDCGLEGVTVAKKLFDVVEVKDVVTYNSIISAMVKVGELKEAQKVFAEMPERDQVSWNTILDIYVKSGEMTAAFEVFQKMPSRNVVSWSTLISGYAKNDDIEMARVLFDKMPEKNLVTWSIMICAYIEKGLFRDANKLYNQMEDTGLKLDDAIFPKDVIYLSILSACADSGFQHLGKEVHHSIIQSKYKCSTLLSNALIDMYYKCGLLKDAWQIFNTIKRKDIISWNIMIHGFALHGHGQKALHLFNTMKREGFSPNNVTFVGILTACGHAGLVKEGLYYFHSMENDYNISPQIEHYGCMIDLLGRDGCLNEAFKLVDEMPFKPNVVIWSSILGACRMYNAVELAEEVLLQLVQLEPDSAGNFCMLSNIYAAGGDWGSVAKARLQMRSANGKRESGASTIELNDEFHEFTVMDTSHPKSERIHQTINGLNQHLRRLAPTVVN